MRIAYLCLEPQQSRFHISGYAVHLNAMMRELERAGHEVMPLVLGEWLNRQQTAREPSAGAKRSLKATVKRLVPGLLWESMKDLRPIWYDRRFYRRYRRALREFRPDVIYEQVAFMSTAGPRLAAELDLPRMAELHAPMVEERTRDGRNSLLAGYARAREKRNLMSARRIRVVSSALKHFLLEQGVAEDKVVVQPNGTDPAVFGPAANADQTVRLRYGLQGRLVFGFAGSFFRWHRIDVLIRAFGKIAAKCPDAVMLIVGAGEGDSELRELAAALGVTPRVHFTGNVSHGDMAAHYAAMDVCCQAASHWYGSPLKIFEYGAMQKPVIAPDLRPVRDVLEDGKDAILVPSGDVEAQAAAMKRLYDDAALRMRLAESLHRKVVTQYTWEQVAGNVLREMEKIVADHRAERQSRAGANPAPNGGAMTGGARQ